MRVVRHPNFNRLKKTAWLWMLPMAWMASSIIATPIRLDADEPAAKNKDGKRPVIGRLQPMKRSADGLPHLFQINEKVFSGAQPEGDAGFASLKKMGVRVIVSVDGAKPDIERAKKAGLTYIHLPIGYDGVSRERALQLVKAMKETTGPMYIHCHHGKHRGPTAAAIACLGCNQQTTVSEATSMMKSIGADPRYAGLYRSVDRFQRPTSTELAKLSPLPETVDVGGVAQAMVSLDSHWDKVKSIRARNWKPSAEDPESKPETAALHIVEAYAESARLPEFKKKPAGFLALFNDGWQGAKELERLLRSEPRDLKKVEVAFQKIAGSCLACHSKYRDLLQAEP